MRPENALHQHLLRFFAVEMGSARCFNWFLTGRKAKEQLRRVHTFHVLYSLPLGRGRTSKPPTQRLVDAALSPLRVCSWRQHC